MKGKFSELKIAKMKIKGLQKTTLVDYPGKVACTIFLYGCNFKCGFCHNPELVIMPAGKTPEYSSSEILEFLEKRRGQLDGICITGGEPCLNLDLDFLKKVKDIGYSIKLDTNGSFPEKLDEIIDLGLVDYIAMDIKASRGMYEKVVNSKVFIDRIEKSIKIISDFGNYEFRTTIVEKFHSVSEVKNMMDWLKEIVGGKMKNYYLQGFKNSGKMIDENFQREGEVSPEYLEKLKKIAKDYFENVGVRV